MEHIHKGHVCPYADGRLCDTGYCEDCDIHRQYELARIGDKCLSCSQAACTSMCPNHQKMRGYIHGNQEVIRN